LDFLKMYLQALPLPPMAFWLAASSPDLSNPLKSGLCFPLQNYEET
jgi:hypothetical protein